MRYRTDNLDLHSIRWAQGEPKGKSGLFLGVALDEDGDETAPLVFVWGKASSMRRLGEPKADHVPLYGWINLWTEENEPLKIAKFYRLDMEM